MKKILVTTDFSVNSKAGIRYAIQLAEQGNFKLRFVHVYHIMRPTQWAESQWTSYLEAESRVLKNKLHTFVSKIYESMGVENKAIDCALERSISASEGIFDHAVHNGFDCICVSTLGAGTIRKILGTNTSWLLNNSTLPLLVIPKSAKNKTIDNIIYSSDFSNLSDELKLSVAFSKAIGAELGLLHFRMADDTAGDDVEVDKQIKKITKYPVKLISPKRNVLNSLTEDISLVMKKNKPDLMIMFTRQQKGFLNNLFMATNTNAVADSTKYPLLAFMKK